MKYLLQMIKVLILFAVSVNNADADSRPLWPHSISYSYTEGIGPVKGNSYKLLINSNNVEWSRITKGSPGKYETAKKQLL